MYYGLLSKECRVRGQERCFAKEAKMKKRLLIALLSILMVAGLLAGCGKKSGESGGSDTGKSKVTYDDGFPENVLRVKYSADPESGDPAKTTADYILMMNCLDTLVATETNEKGENVTVPSLAESWEVSEDGLTYTFKLRNDVKFSNGEPLTSDDVLYTIDRMLQPDRGGVNASWMVTLKGGQDMLDGKINTIDGLGFKATDDYNFTLTLQDAYSPFLASLSTPMWSIVNREAGDKADQAGGGVSTSVYGSDPDYFVGSGPFIMKEWKLNDYVYLETNKNYWKGASKLDGILIRIIPDAQTEKMAFDSGQLDIFDLDGARDQIPFYTQDDKWKNNIVKKEVLGTSYLSMNENVEALSNVKVRKALQMALDRDKIIKDLYYGAAVPATSFLAKGVPGYKEMDPIPYDPEGAKALLKEAGYENGFTMTLYETSNATQDDKQIDEFISNQFSEIGVTLNIETLDEATWYAQRGEGLLDMYRTLWIADYNDPDNFLYQMYGGQNNKKRSWNYKNQEAIDRLEKARYIVDPEARVKEYEWLDKTIIRDDAAMIPLWHNLKIRVLQDRVKGFVPMWAGYGDCNFYGVYFE